MVKTDHVNEEVERQAQSSDLNFLLLKVPPRGVLVLGTPEERLVAQRALSWLMVMRQTT